MVQPLYGNIKSRAISQRQWLIILCFWDGRQVKTEKLSLWKKTGAAFSLDKLNWVNSEYLKQIDSTKLNALVKEFLKKHSLLPDSVTDKHLENVIGLFRERATTLMDFSIQAKVFFSDDYEYSEDAQPILEKNLSEQVQELIKRLSGSVLPHKS